MDFYGCSHSSPPQSVTAREEWRKQSKTQRRWSKGRRTETIDLQQQKKDERLEPESEAMVNNTSTLFLWPSVIPLTACTAAPVLVPPLGQDWLSSVLRAQLVLPRSCGRTERSGRGDVGAGVWQAFSASAARCSEFRRFPGRRRASGWRTFRRGTSRRPASSLLSRSSEGSSIWWSLSRSGRRHEREVRCCPRQQLVKERDWSYLIWTVFLSEGKSCCRRRKRLERWVPAQQRAELNESQTHDSTSPWLLQEERLVMTRHRCFKNLNLEFWGIWAWIISSSFVTIFRKHCFAFSLPHN